MTDATRDSLPPVKPTDATKTLGDLMMKEAASREAQHQHEKEDVEEVKLAGR
jgi:hypothetical protein